MTDLSVCFLTDNVQSCSDDSGCVSGLRSVISDVEPCVLDFRVKYYPSDPEKFREELTRYVLCDNCHFLEKMLRFNCLLFILQITKGGFEEILQSQFASITTRQKRNFLYCSELSYLNTKSNN